MAKLNNRVLHPNDVLDRPGDPEGNIKLWSYGLPGRADLSINRQPFTVADRTRCCEIGAQYIRQLLCDSDILLRFDAAAYSDDNFGLSEIDRGFGFLKRLFRCHANVAYIDVHRL